MYLGVLYVVLELEPEVTSNDRERLLRSLRDRVRAAFGQRLTVRYDGESAIMCSFFDESYARTRSRCDEILEKIESSGEARIELSNPQVFMWFEGAFQECADDEDEDDGEGESGETIRYADNDEDERPEKPRLIPSRFARRNVRVSSRR
jgi:hypothetical protein